MHAALLAGLNGTVDTLYYIAPCMAITLAPFALWNEAAALSDSQKLFHGTQSVAVMTVVSVLLGACLAFCLTLSEFLLVKYAGRWALRRIRA